MPSITKLIGETATITCTVKYKAGIDPSYDFGVGVSIEKPDGTFIDLTPLSTGLISLGSVSGTLTFSWPTAIYAAGTYTVHVAVWKQSVPPFIEPKLAEDTSWTITLAAPELAAEIVSVSVT